MKFTKIFAIIVLVILIIFGYLYFNNSHPLVGDKIIVQSFTNNGVSTGKLLVQIPFLQNLKNRQSIRVAVDENGDETFSPEEVLMENVRLVPHMGMHGGFYVEHKPPRDGSLAQVTVNGKNFKVHVLNESVETESLFDLATITDPENATKGLGAITVFGATTEPFEIINTDVPDITQRKGECGPTAAANNLIALVSRHGGEDLIVGDPQDFIENLKRHMNWTPENGVVPDEFVDGKNRWAAAAGVPIRTTKVGDKNGISTIEAIRDALVKGGAVELRIVLADGDAKAQGGHMVTVTGIHQGEGQTYIDINDPFTSNQGTETVEIRSNQIVNYGPWNGLTVLSWGFVQTWEGHPTGELLDTMTDAEIAGIREFAGESPTIKVIRYGGKYLPTSQLKVENEIGCGADHWHAARGGAVTATDGTQVPDPGPECGYGKVKENSPIDISVPKPQGSIEVRGLEGLKTR